MFSNELRDSYEFNAREVVKYVYDGLYGDCTYTIPDDEYSTWDISMTRNGSTFTMENKTRSDKYRYNDRVFDSGYYLAAAKNDGNNNVFNYIFPNDKIMMITDVPHLQGLKPKKTYVEHIRTCDPDSPAGYVYNYIVPIDRWWVIDYSSAQPIIIKNAKKLINN